MPPIFLVTGPTAVGKTTTARALAEVFPRSVHVPVDELRHLVVRGRAMPGPTWDENVVAQFGVARAAAIGLALDHAAAGFAVVIDDVYDPLGLREYRDMLDRPDSLGVLLYPSEAEARRRNAARHGGTPDPVDERAIGHVYGFIGPIVDDLRLDGWLVLDTTELDVAQTVAAILGS